VDGRGESGSGGGGGGGEEEDGGWLLFDSAAFAFLLPACPDPWGRGWRGLIISERGWIELCIL
jgi:hypothetical protein